MKRLGELLGEVPHSILQGSEDTPVTSIENDSRKVSAGSLFFCIRGAVTDGHKYAQDVAEKGACVIVAEEKVDVPDNVTVVLTPDSRRAMALIACAWYDHPSRKLHMIGVTGTKGKTTTTYMIRSILEGAGVRTGLIGTIDTIIGDEVIPSEHTTPESVKVQEYLDRMVKAGITVCVMEVSSQALMLDRTAGIDFELGIFTNIEPDHIGPAEHESFEDYLSCKAKLFRQCRTGILNYDDPHLDKILEGHTCEVETFGFGEGADLRAVDEQLVTGKGWLGVSYRLEGLINMDVTVDVPGRFSVYNSMCAAAVCRHFGIDNDTVAKALKGAKVKGRIELVKVSDEFTLMIDYAHNAMALESLLTTLREYEPGRLVCLFGCGGNRSKLRRFEMGEVSGRLADLTIITSDNPRNEDPEAIMDDIVTGISKTDGEYVRISDRKDAIRYAIRNGRPGDIVVLAGKGHEDYQEIKGKKYSMDERVLIKEILAETP